MYDPTKPYKKEILKLIRETWDTPFLSIKKDIYPIIKKRFSYREIDHTDGIGTKGVYHWKKKTFKNAVLDALAMNLNDLLLLRAQPYKLQNHIILPEDDKRAILEMIKTLVRECRKRKIAITGGETSVQDNIEGIDISLTVSGFIKEQKPNLARIGDKIIGLKSNGLHSNGFTKVREVFKRKFKSDFTLPSNIYWDKIYKLNQYFDIHGMMHITGGAFSKLKDFLKGASARIKSNHQLLPQKIFREIYRKGISDEEMYKTFNCGIGFLLTTSSQDVDKIISSLKKFKAEIIGEIVSGDKRIEIESMFSKKIIRL